MANSKINFNIVLLILLVSSSSAMFRVEAIQSETSFLVSQPPQNRQQLQFDHLKNTEKYRGGILYGCSIAVLWFVGGVVYGGVKVITSCCCCKTNQGHQSRKHKRFTSRNWTILVAAIFAILAIASSGGVLAGNLQFLLRAKTAVGDIVGVFDEATVRIYNTTQAMREVSTNLTKVRNANPNVYGFLANTSNTVDSKVRQVEEKVEDIRALIDDGLKTAQLATILIMSLNLVAIASVTVCGTLRLRRALRVFLVLCWFLAVMWWVFFGVYFAVDKVEGDTCTALEDFQRDPNNNSLSSILPCNQLLAADTVLHKFSKGVHHLVNTANEHISQSLGNFVHICNPFSAQPEYRYQPEKCLKNTMTVGRAAEVLRMLSCPDSVDGSCLGGIYVDHNVFYTVVGYLKSLNSLIGAYSDMDNLAECKPVKDAFSVILNRHCEPLKKDTKMVWASILTLAITTMLLILVWIVEDHQEQDHQIEDAAVKPYCMKIDLMEAGLREEDREGTKS